MCKAYEADDLCHDTGTLEGLAGMLRRAEELDQGKVLLNDVEGCRLWVGHGTEDRVTSFKATARFMDRLQINDKTFRVYDRHYHKRESSSSIPWCFTQLFQYMTSLEKTKSNLQMMSPIGYLLDQAALTS